MLNEKLYIGHQGCGLASYIVQHFLLLLIFDQTRYLAK